MGYKMGYGRNKMAYRFNTLAEYYACVWDYNVFN